MATSPPKEDAGLPRRPTRTEGPRPLSQQHLFLKATGLGGCPFSCLVPVSAWPRLCGFRGTQHRAQHPRARGISRRHQAGLRAWTSWPEGDLILRVQEAPCLRTNRGLSCSRSSPSPSNSTSQKQAWLQVGATSPQGGRNSHSSTGSQSAAVLPASPWGDAPLRAVFS